MNVTARTASAAKRMVAMGSVSAIGSLGLTFASPLAQTLITTSGWQTAMVGFLGLVVVMLPAALLAGRTDKIEVEANTGVPQSVGQAVKEAIGHPGYVVLAIAFFVCGLQLVFITTHLPTYLAICGMDPSVGANALALIGLFNVIGSYLFGWLGGRYSKRVLLGGIYVLRSLFITAYFMLPPTPASTLVFAAAMGTLWLGVVPLVSGLVVHLFGLRYMATLSGIAFFSHQVGSFIGAWGGGLIYSSLGNYDRAWQGAVVIGILAGLFQMTMNIRPSQRMLDERSGAVPALGQPSAALPVARQGLGDGDPAFLHLDIAAGRQVLEHAADHLARGADPVGDFLLGQLAEDDELVVLLHREVEQQPRHAPVDVQRREAPHVVEQAARAEDQRLDEAHREFRVLDDEVPEHRLRDDEELRGLEGHHRGRPGAGVEHHLAEILARAEDVEVDFLAVLAVQEHLDAARMDHVHRVGAVALVDDDLVAREGLQLGVRRKRLQLLVLHAEEARVLGRALRVAAFALEGGGFHAVILK